jgi:hypothetical protein
MITQNSNNRAAGSTSKTCDPIIPIGGIDKTNNKYVALSLSTTGAIATSTISDPLALASLGLWGSNYYLDIGQTTTPLGKYYTCIQVIAAAVLNVTAGNTREFDSAGTDVNLAPLSGLSIPAGTMLYGYYSKVVLISGHVKCMANPLY